MEVWIESLLSDRRIVEVQGDQRALLRIGRVDLARHQAAHVDDVLAGRDGLHVHRGQLAHEV
jgi:hypothetical protein